MSDLLFLLGKLEWVSSNTPTAIWGGGYFKAQILCFMGNCTWEDVGFQMKGLEYPAKGFLYKTQSPSSSISTTKTRSHFLDLSQVYCGELIQMTCNNIS